MDHRTFFVLLGLMSGSANLSAQALIDGRLLGERFPGSAESMAFSAILCFDSLPGPGREPAGFRTFETEPPGWFRFNSDAGNHTLVFTGPNHFFRPIVLNNVFVERGEKLLNLRPAVQFDFANFSEREWDPKPARAYYQKFIAKGTSVTSVGFRVATDGVDGGGPLSQNLLVSIHRRGAGTPDTLEQVGPSALVPEVDSGGAKNYIWCAGWNSGEVPLTPGETYAVQIRAEREGGTFQVFWRSDQDAATDCYRVGVDKTGYMGRKIWLAVATDRDGLLVPYAKRVHKQFGQFAGFAPRWVQTYVAQGRSLASVVLYAAVGGAQPPLHRQRLAVRVREGGPTGPIMGIEKIAIGNGNYTGDASWGVFGTGFAPGEVPLTPGKTYALEFESMENYKTLHGYVNIKGHASDDRPGFNPYRKVAPDDYVKGKAYKNGSEEMPFDLDMQVIEYRNAATNWGMALEATDLLVNGRMEEFLPAESAVPQIPKPPKGVSGYQEQPTLAAHEPAGWRTHSVSPGTRLGMVVDPRSTNHFARIYAVPGSNADGTFVQSASTLDHRETYRLAGRVRSSWAVDFEHQCLIGLDPTGQDTDPEAASIRWMTFPPRHGQWIEFTSEPVRPVKDSIAVWLRAKSTAKSEFVAPFEADFDDISLRRVQTTPP